MQRELPASIRILGVNQIGAEGDNPTICNGRDLPWLQDDTVERVWARWAVEYRDVVILNGNNEPVAVYNLTQHDLSLAANYDELKQMLLGVAGP